MFSSDRNSCQALRQPKSLQHGKLLLCLSAVMTDYLASISPKQPTLQQSNPYLITRDLNKAKPTSLRLTLFSFNQPRTEPHLNLGHPCHTPTRRQLLLCPPSDIPPPPHHTTILVARRSAVKPLLYSALLKGVEHLSFLQRFRQLSNGIARQSQGKIAGLPYQSGRRTKGIYMTQHVNSFP